jgi:isopentenyl-diphosphate delta-isomerase type 1
MAGVNVAGRISCTSADKEDELLDLVDEKNRVVGQVLRGSVHGNPALRHRAVHVFVRNEAGCLFLQKRSEGKKIQPGKWDTSIGGHVEAGESYEDAAKKETAEELGIPPEASSSMRFSHEYVWESDVETEHVRTYLLAHEGPFKLQPEEISEGRFWSTGELKEAAYGGLFTPNLEEELRLLGIL